MSFGPVINVAIALVMTFAVMALVVSGVTEAISNFLQTRSRNLAAGIRALLNDPTMSGLAGKVMAHAGASPLSSIDGGGLSPACMDAKHFAAALVDVIQNDDPLQPLNLKEAIDKIADPQIKQFLSGLYARVDGDSEKLHLALADWFDTAMTQVSELYKRDIRRISLLIALILAAGLNVDALHIARAVWATPDLVLQVKQLGTASDAAVTDLAVLAAAGLPLGWTGIAFTWTAVPGWLITAAASMLGAPFWFDMLTRLRGAPAAK